MERKYFGTDGIRGKAGEWPIHAEFVLKLGWAAGRVFAKQGSGTVLIGKDTRISGYMFESVLQAGLSAAGVNCRLLGPVPTPAIAYLTRTVRAKAGIVISASHNPFYDNGIKFFSETGKKLSDQIELDIERYIERPMLTVDSSILGKSVRFYDAGSRYIEFCKSTIPMGMDFKGIKIVIDCAHGASYFVAPCVFEELGAEVIVINNKPDGLNINLECGSIHPKMLQMEVLDQNADVGIAFDGDADRVIMVDHKGELVDGDEILFIIALSRLSQNVDLKAVVGTIMTNAGLETALKNYGVSLMRASVGDRYVLEKMEKYNLLLGGETSGHVICLDRTITGDGIITALQVIRQLVDTNRTLHESKKGVVKRPQILINLPITKEFNISQDQAISKEISGIRAKLADKGRVVLRLSGTEPVVRIMVEANETNLAGECAEEISSIIQKRLKLIDRENADKMLEYEN